MVTPVGCSKGPLRSAANTCAFVHADEAHGCANSHTRSGDVNAGRRPSGLSDADGEFFVVPNKSKRRHLARGEIIWLRGIGPDEVSFGLSAAEDVNVSWKYLLNGPDSGGSRRPHMVVMRSTSRC